MASTVRAYHPSLLYPFAALLPLAALLFVSAGKERVAIGLAIVACAPLVLVLFKRLVKHLRWGSLIIYVFLIFQIYFWVSNRLYFHIAYSPLLFFLPAILLEFMLRTRNRSVPLFGAWCVMLAGCLVSNIHQLISFHGAMFYPFAYDKFFLAAIAFFFLLYIFLRLDIISLRQTLVAIALSSLPMLVMIIFRYALSGNLGALFSERFGSSIEIGPNIVSSFLDITFPLSLFLAISEKNRINKYLLFALAGLYGFCLLSTSSRGSIIGFVVLVAYFAWRSRSLKNVFLILAVAGALGYMFGSKMFERLVMPNRVDMYSNLGRVELLRAGFKTLKENSFFYGVGMDNFRIEKFSHGFPTWFDLTRAMSSHNAHLEIWLGWGLIGLAGWIYLWIGSIIYTARIKPASEYAYLKAPFILISIAFISHGFFDSIIAAFPFLLLVCGYLACVSFVIFQDRTAVSTARNAAPAGIRS